MHWRYSGEQHPPGAGRHGAGVSAGGQTRWKLNRHSNIIFAGEGECSERWRIP